ncbi:hypothetical protein ACFQ60_03815 [Streptomyces zhihengii]
MHLVEHIRSHTENALTNTNRKMTEVAANTQTPDAPLMTMRKGAT